jgi:hypothetical protein
MERWIGESAVGIAALMKNNSHVTNPAKPSSRKMIVKKSLLTKTLLIAASLPLLAGCIVKRQPRRVVVAEQPAPAGEVVVESPSEPPPVRVEVQPARPGPDYIWIGAAGNGARAGSGRRAAG